MQSSITSTHRSSIDPMLFHTCFNIISQLAHRLVQSLRQETCDDFKFFHVLKKSYTQLLEFETFHSNSAFEALDELISHCRNNFTIRSHSNEKQTPARVPSQKVCTARTPNFCKLDRIVEESPKLFRTAKKSAKRVMHKRESSSHAYYENMMGKYLKMSLRTPIKGHKGENPHKNMLNQVQLTDGMFFRLF